MIQFCTWENNDARVHVHNKKAIGACMFLSFLGYTAAVILSEAKRGSKISANLKRFYKDVATGQLFFFIVAMCVHVLDPNVFPTILLYLYMFTQMLQAVGYAIENKMVSLVSMALQIILVFVLFIVVMADDWCDFFLYRSYT